MKSGTDERGSAMGTLNVNCAEIGFCRTGLGPSLREFLRGDANDLTPPVRLLMLGF